MSNQHANQNDFEETCKVKLVGSRKEIDATIIQFKPEQVLIVYINKTVRMVLRWSGQYYEGREGGLNFESDGPARKVIKASRVPRR